VFAALAPDPDMRSFGRGIRRRVPTMLEGDRDRMELLYSLLFTLPGSPVLLYGEEIGLGDDQRVEGRGAVRVAMQWNPGPNAGFTTGEPAVPLVTDHPAVLAHRRDWQGRGVLVLHNLGPEPVKAGVALGDDVEAGLPMADLLGNRHHEPATTGQPMALAGFGYRWLRLPG